jgi:lysozyme
MTTTTPVMFGIDASRYQGTVNWATVDQSTGFGWEKCTEGHTYVNPYWAAAKTAMTARAQASGFVPGAYLFLRAGDGAGQAEWFAKNAGNLDGFAIAVDIEPSGTSKPTLADGKACVARLRQLYPHHPVGGYIPHWYWAGADTTFVDWLWASHYVTGTGGPRDLYAKVPASYWDAYGGRQVSLLQFTSTATVPGVSGLVDCSAFRGGAADLRKLVLPASGPFRHEVQAGNTLSLHAVAAARGTSVDHLTEVTEANVDAAHLAVFDAYMALDQALLDVKAPHPALPAGLVYWTSQP